MTPKKKDALTFRQITLEDETHVANKSRVFYATDRSPPDPPSLFLLKSSFLL
jgi:hypothetical protein